MFNTDLVFILISRIHLENAYNIEYQYVVEYVYITPKSSVNPPCPILIITFTTVFRASVTWGTVLKVFYTG